MSAVLLTRAALVEAPDDLDELIEFFHARRWSDGLPIVPPTRERVERMLACTTRKSDEIIANVAPSFGAATVERIAINAVMAGCRADYLPVLIAAVQAMSAPEFNLQGIQATTNPVAVWLVVNGPMAEQLGVNGGMNCLGQGTVANATLGRALRLIQQNIGGALPGDMDRATHGQPGKFSFCCSENEAQSPWESLHVERGFKRDQSTVTVIGAAGTHNMNIHAKDADDLLRVIADTMAFPTSNDYWLGGEPWLIISPEHAEILRAGGLSKADVKRRLWEESKLRASRMSKKELMRTQIARTAELGAVTEDTLLPASSEPEGIGIVVAGGPGTHSVYVASFGDTRAVTREV
ncbi:MAG: UGSC family (seleno)protein, partial [Burkholderiales bacterium]